MKFLNGFLIINARINGMKIIKAKEENILKKFRLYFVPVAINRINGIVIGARMEVIVVNIKDNEVFPLKISEYAGVAIPAGIANKIRIAKEYSGANIFLVKR